MNPFFVWNLCIRTALIKRIQRIRRATNCYYCIYNYRGIECRVRPLSYFLINSLLLLRWWWRPNKVLKVHFQDAPKARTTESVWTNNLVMSALFWSESVCAFLVKVRYWFWCVLGMNSFKCRLKSVCNLFQDEITHVRRVQHFKCAKSAKRVEKVFARTHPKSVRTKKYNLRANCFFTRQ